MLKERARRLLPATHSTVPALLAVTRAICQRPNPLTTAGTQQGAASLALRWQHNAVEMLRFAAEVARRADMEALVRRRRLHDLVRQNLDPVAVDLDLVVIAHLASRCRTAVGEIAARDLGLRRHQLLVEIPVPLVMAVAEVAVLSQCVRGQEDAERQEDGSEQASHHANPLGFRTGLSAGKPR